MKTINQHQNTVINRNKLLEFMQKHNQQMADGKELAFIVLHKGEIIHWDFTSLMPETKSLEDWQSAYSFFFLSLLIGVRNYLKKLGRATSN